MGTKLTGWARLVAAIEAAAPGKTTARDDWLNMQHDIRGCARALIAALAGIYAPDVEAQVAELAAAIRDLQAKPTRGRKPRKLAQTTEEANG